MPNTRTKTVARSDWSAIGTCAYITADPSYTRIIHSIRYHPIGSVFPNRNVPCLSSIPLKVEHSYAPISRDANELFINEYIQFTCLNMFHFWNKIKR